jgi:hypothetical protein
MGRSCVSEDFYYMGAQMLEQYDQWREVVHEVLRQKTLRAM